MSNLSSVFPLPLDMAHHNHHLDLKFKDGYSSCFKEVLSFLSLQPKQRTTEVRLMNHFKLKEAVGVPPVPPSRYNQAKQAELSNSSCLWRPW